jgi:hypothetical protein
MALNPNRTLSGHSFITGNMVRLRRRFPPRKAAPGPYKIVAQLPERDGQFQYRIKSGCEPFYRTVKESELEVAGGAPLDSASSNELEDRRVPMRGAST